MEENIVNTIVSIVSNLGFPIAAFLLMWHTANNTIKENTRVISELKEEISKLGK